MSILRKQCCCGDCFIRPLLCLFRDGYTCELLPQFFDPRPPLVRCPSGLTCQEICQLPASQRVVACLGEDPFTIDGLPGFRIVFPWTHKGFNPDGSDFQACYYFDRQPQMGPFFQFLEGCPPDNDGGVCGSPIQLPYDSESEFACLLELPEFIGDSCNDCCTSCVAYCLESGNCQSKGFSLIFSLLLAQDISTPSGICNCWRGGSDQCDDVFCNPPGIACLDNPAPCPGGFGCLFGNCQFALCLDPTIVPCAQTFLPHWTVQQPAFGFVEVGCNDITDDPALASAVLSCGGDDAMGNPQPNWTIVVDLDPTRCCPFGEEILCDPNGCTVCSFTAVVMAMGVQNQCPDENSVGPWVTVVLEEGLASAGVLGVSAIAQPCPPLPN